jgi:TM2 domain-containing membrane protein YozV
VKLFIFLIIELILAIISLFEYIYKNGNPMFGQIGILEGFGEGDNREKVT